MSRTVLMIAGVVVLVMALLASFNIGTVVEPAWHVVLKWIGGAIMVLVAYMDKGKKAKSDS
ncbi:MAG: hypothetical protein AB7T02_10410 [Mesotoga sp.]|uniref:hypothetical protein n=1 Tax=unclassified Mesotoga TaxID=1184398 RepID=UPI000C19A91E|nr:MULTISPECIES: hypothetical protein [unclassified Mesotoga]PIJ61552.1 hypothetical protein V513_09420 [Mesotoga sp. H07.pep.5.3]RLL84848.1 hypothetical protein Y696_11350 [Mesotoga sp. H07pep.5.4]